MTAKKEANVSKKNVSKKNSTKAEIVEQKAVEVKKEEVREAKKISNTQKCADMIVQFARDAKYTRTEICNAVSDALKALSVVTVRTMLSDLQNAKYARRYSTHTIAVNKETKIVTIANEIKQ